MISAFEFLEPSWRRWRRWICAGLLVGGLHVGGAAAALWQWPAVEVDEEPEGAMMLELAPMAVSPRQELVNLALGQLAEESEATPPVEEVKEIRPEDIPPVEEAPLAPDPEVELEKVTEIEEPEEKEDKPPQEQMAAVAASQAAAPPPIEAPEGPRAMAPHQGTSNKPNQAVLSWHKSLHLHLNKHKRYPSEARSRRVEGVVTVAFAIDGAGQVTGRRILKGSGSPLLDQEALAMLERASPLPAPPVKPASGALNLTLPVQFNIR